MVRHLILWELKDELDAEARVSVLDNMKEGLEGLLGKVPGLKEIHVQTETLPTANVDIMLDSLLEDEEALKGYAVHPDHVHVADTLVRPFTKARHCIDFEV